MILLVLKLFKINFTHWTSSVTSSYSKSASSVESSCLLNKNFYLMMPSGQN